MSQCALHRRGFRSTRFRSKFIAFALYFRSSTIALRQYDTVCVQPATTRNFALHSSRTEIFRLRCLFTGTVFVRINILDDIEFYRIRSQPPLPIHQFEDELDRESHPR